MTYADSTYHRILRISTLVMAVVLVFQSGLLDDRTTGLFTSTTSYLGAAVGMSASVAPNEYNTITAELTRQQQLLAEREAAVAEREVAVSLNDSGTGGSTERTTYLLAAILFVQLLLIVLNYALDFLRNRELAQQRNVSQAGVAVGS